MTDQHNALTAADKYMPDGILVRPLRPSDLECADHTMRLAFGTYIGLPDPMSFLGDASFVRTRWLIDPQAAFAAEVDARFAGSNFATNWGSVGFFGPLSVHPEHWDRGVGKRLMEPIMECFAAWHTRLAGLFTFAQSPKHVGLYGRFGFWPRFLTAVMSKPVEPAAAPSRPWLAASGLQEVEREAWLASCRDLTDSIYEGLDLSREIRVSTTENLGETVLLAEDSGLSGLAVCYCGPGSEGGSGACFIKFGAARPGPNAGAVFDQLLKACEQMAARKGLTRLVAGVNAAREEAYRHLLANGFRVDFQGVAMHRPNQAGYNRQGIYLIDDWR